MYNSEFSLVGRVYSWSAGVWTVKAHRYVEWVWPFVQQERLPILVMVYLLGTLDGASWNKLTVLAGKKGLCVCVCVCVDMCYIDKALVNVIFLTK